MAGALALSLATLAFGALGGIGRTAIDVQAPATSVTLDRIVARVNNNEIVQSLEVRQARLLRLFGPAVVTDDAVLDQLIVRRLELADVARYQVPEPGAADVAARQAKWQASLATGGTAVNLAALLSDAGMSEAALTAWFRDDARIEAVVTQRFTMVPATRDEVVAYVRDHAPSFAQPGGRPADPDDPAVQVKARAEIASVKRAAAVADWINALRKRADIQKFIR
jgi:hypothetical protein